MDLGNIKKFWEERAEQYKQKPSLSVTNLEEDDELQQSKVRLEREHVFRLLKILPEMNVLDLGAGVGAWSILFAEKCRKVVAVEYSENMVKVAKQIAKGKLINNIEFVCRDIVKFQTTRNFDVIFCSGLLLYLDDAQFLQLSSNMKNYSQKGTLLFLREPVGIKGRYEIVNKYSEALKTYYSALYRTNEELIETFSRSGYTLICDEDMFEEGSPLNKWKETRLRLFVFRYEGK